MRWLLVSLALLAGCKGFHAEPFVGASTYTADDSYAVHVGASFVEDYPTGGQEVAPTRTTFLSPEPVWQGAPWYEPDGTARPPVGGQEEPAGQAGETDEEGQGHHESIRWGPFSASASALVVLIAGVIAALKRDRISELLARKDEQ